MYIYIYIRIYLFVYRYTCIYIMVVIGGILSLFQRIGIPMGVDPASSLGNFNPFFHKQVCSLTSICIYQRKTKLQT